MGLFLAVVGWGSLVFLYWRTDVAYERLATLQPKTRGEVEATLIGFRGCRVSEPDAMQPGLRDKLGKDRQYWRYTRYPGFSIDVVYEPDGSVFSLWPEYE